MIQTILTSLISLTLIFLILIRIPEKDNNSQKFNISLSILGSPKSTDLKLQKTITILIFIFFIINIITDLKDT
jgi:protein translocase SecG subunit